MQAMGIESEEDVYKMTEFFMKYKQGRETKEKRDENVSVSSFTITQVGVSISLICNCTSVSQTEKGDSDQSESDAEPTDLINPNEIVVALKDFTAQYCRPRSVHLCFYSFVYLCIL